MKINQLIILVICQIVYQFKNIMYQKSLYYPQMKIFQETDKSILVIIVVKIGRYAKQAQVHNTIINIMKNKNSKYCPNKSEPK